MARSRANGEGSVYEVKTGSSKGKFRATYHDSNGKRVYLPLSATRTEAKKKIADALRHVQGGVPVPDPKLTLDSWMTTWFRDVLAPSKRSGRATFDNYSTLYRVHVRDELGHVKLAELHAEHVAKLLARKLLPKDEGGEGYSVSTVNRVRAILLSALDVAEDWGKVPKNVVRKTESPGSGNRGNRAMTLAEESRLLAACEGERLGAIYVTALGTGLRPGELLGLHWSDLDLEGAKLTVRTVARLDRGRFIVDDKLKTRTSLPRGRFARRGGDSTAEPPHKPEAATAPRLRDGTDQPGRVTNWRPTGWCSRLARATSSIATTCDGTSRPRLPCSRDQPRRRAAVASPRASAHLCHRRGRGGRAARSYPRGSLGTLPLRVTADTYSHPSPARAADAAARQSARLARARDLIKAQYP